MYRDSKHSLAQEREKSAASQRITFQEEFAAETQEGRRSMYAGVRVRTTEEFPRRPERARIKERGRECSCARQGRGIEPEVERSESERSRKHRRYPVIAPWRVRGDA